MSNVVSPRGPLPPRVYWRRRLLLIAVVLGAVALVGRLLTGGGDTEPVAERGRATPTPAAESTGPAATPKARTPRKRTARRAEPGREPANARGGRASGASSEAPGAARGGQPAASAALRGPTGPLARPTGPCRAADVAVVPDVQDTDAFGPVPVRLGLSTTAGQACTFAFGPDSVALQITSGDDQVWQSVHCAQALAARSVVVRPGWLSYVTVEWNGRRGSESCGAGNEFAQPGYYWAQAAAIGGEPARSQFELETPPPEPKTKPSKQKSAKPSGSRSEAPSEPSGQGSGGSGQASSDEPRQRAGSGTASPDDEQGTGDRDTRRQDADGRGDGGSR